MTNATLSGAKLSGTSKTREEALTLARRGVRGLLLESQAFRAMAPDAQREIAKNTVEVVNYLVAPEGIPGNTLTTTEKVPELKNDPYALGLADESSSPSRSRTSGEFRAQGAREGAAVAGVLLREVNFPEFVSGLISGVFHSIVTSSIQQMEAYGKLVADVAKSLNTFRDENVSANQGRDHLVEQFPETFMIDVDTGAEGGPAPRVRLREGVDESAALQKVNSLPMDGGPLQSLDLEDEAVEQKLVQASRTQLATSRQQLLATMVLMGINRIIVTDGRIAAKVMYDFQARDTFKRSATMFDYENFGTQTVSEGEYESDYQGGDRNSSYSQDSGWQSESRDGSYYAKGKYKTTSEPAVKITSAVAETTDAALTTKASLAGSVEVNFKSETFPLEKMADSFQIGQIQNAAKPKGTASAPVPAGGTAQSPTTPTPKA